MSVTGIEQAARLRAAFDTIEEAYEFMLAYAAQGRKTEAGAGGGESQIRNFLQRFAAACDDILDATSEGLGGTAGAAFAERFRTDIAVARSVLALLLERSNVTSAMVDNSNGLIAMRGFLTDIFFADQVVLPPR